MTAAVEAEGLRKVFRTRHKAAGLRAALGGIESGNLVVLRG